MGKGARVGVVNELVKNDEHDASSCHVTSSSLQQHSLTMGVNIIAIFHQFWFGINNVFHHQLLQ